MLAGNGSVQRRRGIWLAADDGSGSVCVCLCVRPSSRVTVTVEAVD